MSDFRDQANAIAQQHAETMRKEDEKDVKLFEIGAAGVLGALAAKVLFGNRGS